MKSFDALMDDAQRHCSTGDCEQVVEALEQAVTARPSDYRLHYWLGFCHAGGCRRHKYTHPDIALEYLRHALQLAPEGTEGSAAILEALGSTCLESPTMTRAEALKTAIECHRSATAVYCTLDKPEAWAREEYNLGNACCELSELTGEDHWSEAVAHYQQALKVRTREKDPQRYGIVLQNLGTAYRHVSDGDTLENMSRCIACYRRAMRLCDRRSHPLRYAGLQVNIANALLALPAGDEAAEARHARHALAHLDRAMAYAGGRGVGREYAIAQHSRAQAFLRLKNLEAAISSLRDAHDAFTECGDSAHAECARLELASILRMGREKSANGIV